MVIFPWLLFLIKGSIQFETKRAEKTPGEKCMKSLDYYSILYECYYL